MWRGSGAGERRPVRDVPQNYAANHVRFFLNNITNFYNYMYIQSDEELWKNN